GGAAGGAGGRSQGIHRGVRRAEARGRHRRARMGRSRRSTRRVRRPRLSRFPSFRGGQGGLATAAGIVFALHWPLGLVLAVIWLTMAFGFKISSLAALVVATLMPLGMFYVYGNALVAWAMVPVR